MSLFFFKSGDPTRWARVEILDEEGATRVEAASASAKEPKDILGARMVVEGRHGGLIADGICRLDKKNGLLHIGDSAYALNKKGEIVFTYFGRPRWEPPIRKEKFSLLPPPEKKKGRFSLLRKILQKI